MYEDPVGYMCERIMIVITCFVILLALSAYYVYVSAKCSIALAYLWLKGVYIEVCYFVYKKWKHFYLRHIELWLVVYGFKRSRTWAEIEQYRLELSAKCGNEIPRTPDMEEGLRQEGYL